MTNRKWNDDQQREESTITGVKALDDGWEIGAGGWRIVVTAAHCEEAPRVGEKMLLFGKGIGFAVRGIVIEGRTYRYETEDEWKASRAAERASDDAARLKKAKDERPERDRRIAALPSPIQKRLRRFLRVDDAFSAKYEEYELFVCEEAALIAAALPDADLIKAFAKKKSDEQKRMVPLLDYAEHSGNTFGAACMIAHLLVARPELVPQAHGALCPLVGCEDYGCWAAHEGQQKGLDHD